MHTYVGMYVCIYTYTHTYTYVNLNAVSTSSRRGEASDAKPRELGWCFFVFKDWKIGTP